MIIEELLGAYALDALDDDEKQLVESHLSQCPSCRDEVRDHREVVARLVGDEVQPPDRVWNGILARIGETPPQTDLAPVIPIEQTRRGINFATTRWIAGVAAGLAVIALSAAVVAQSGRIGDLNAQLTAQEEQIATLASAVQTDPLQLAVTAALTDPGARLANLTGTGTETMLIVVLPDGTGYVFQSTLESLPDNSTYQLWAVVDDKVISAGVLGNSPEIVPFHIDPQGLQGLVITREITGGVPQSEAEPTVAWFEA